MHVSVVKVFLFGASAFSSLFFCFVSCFNIILKIVLHSYKPSNNTIDYGLIFKYLSLDLNLPQV